MQFLGKVKNKEVVEKVFFAVILSAAKNLTRSVILKEVKDLRVPSSCSGQALVATLPQNDNSGSFSTASKDWVPIFSITL
jgi:hypothetical protein